MTASITSTFLYPDSDFTSLGGNPINPAILKQEIVDSSVSIPVASVVGIGTNVRIDLTGNATAADKTELDSVVANHAGGDFAVFPQNEADETETNEGDTGVETTKVSLNTGLMPAGTYLVTWFMEVKLNSDGGSSAGVVARLKVGGTQRGQTSTEKAQYVCFSGTKRLTVEDGQQFNIALTYQRLGAGYTAYAQNASIDITRIN